MRQKAPASYNLPLEFPANIVTNKQLQVLEQKPSRNDQVVYSVPMHQEVPVNNKAPALYSSIKKTPEHALTKEQLGMPEVEPALTRD